MKPKEVTVSVKRLINLGNYENIQYDCQVTMLVEEIKEPFKLSPEEALDETYKYCLNFCKTKVGEEIDRLYKELGRK